MESDGDPTTTAAVPTPVDIALVECESAFEDLLKTVEGGGNHRITTRHLVC